MTSFNDCPGAEQQLLVFVDDHILAVNKPSGLRVIPDGYHPDLPYMAKMLASQFGRLWVVHRLDKETSGILLFARNPVVHRSLNNQFETRQITKTYHALVAGNPPWKEQVISLPLRVNGDRRRRTIVDHQRGKPAVSAVNVLALYDQAALVSVQPHTGYTHQIRAHLAAAGYPILFDQLYRRPTNPSDPILAVATRLALHALQISFIHPHSQTRTQLTAPYPQDFSDMLQAVTRNPLQPSK